MRKFFEYFSSLETLYSKAMAPVCRKFDLTYMEFSIIMFLANNPKFDTAAQIVRYRHLTKSHVSITIHSLENSKLLEGRNDPSDRRIYRLSLTDAAKPIIQAGRATQDEFTNRIFADFTPEERKLVHSFLLRIDKNLTQADEEISASYTPLEVYYGQ